ncbi:ECF-type sigma factor [Tahibacter harae]|uniref:ECF-type sigma factor n=1 Tax=Tahibacter harae TaxID=2963937 RepID=A0ABT1QYL6_9GAMM|nr:ECF-type sigma factor [Tahibacter harae]MCQ4167368.1 ECF-type sigma factor [Tahibacter harae]
MRPEITTLLDACRQGEASARDLLFERIYTELKRIARGTLRRSGPQLTISPSTLVHEVFLRLAGRDEAALADSRHFYSLIAAAMRQIVIDLGRRLATAKHGAGLRRVEMTDGLELGGVALEALLELDQALKHLQDCDAELAELVEWHFFAGLSFAEIGSLRGVTERTVRRHWETARIFLCDALPAGPG